MNGGWAVRVTEVGEDMLAGTAYIDPGDPVFDGHYPGFPILPGLYLVEYVHSLVRAARPVTRPTALELVKFRRPVYPGDTVTIKAGLVEASESIRCRAQVLVDGAEVAEVRLSYPAEVLRRAA
jgi:3-hydroxyacyl-[acyl-carrier-protein] dehydratase